ncbi:MAG TPA: hypoxanthine phosphoribosyltransferase [Firmicutes bacterium]|jgi:hypoxanthine phosphoribosyltransferase|nr:hypoxanthine phosphoribosyltransferase [Bacillota bacterium]
MLSEKTRVLLTQEEIREKVKQLAEAVSRDYKDKKPLLVCVLKGAVVFLADFMRFLSIPVEIDFMAVSSYGHSTTSSGVVRILKDLDSSIEHKDVIILEDIIDSGLTLSYLRENLLSRNPRSIKIVTLLDKPERRVTDIEPDYCGFRIPDEFVVGYGLDYNEKYRNLPDICILLEFAK